MDRARHALAKADAALAAHFDLKDALARVPVLHDGHVAVLEVVRLVGTKAGVGHEQDVVVDLLSVPFEPRGRVLRVVARCRVELLVLCRAEPRPVNDLALRAVRRREIRKVGKPAVPDGRLEHQPQRDDLIMQRANANMIKTTAMQRGMSTLLQNGACKVLEGRTTAEEVLRVTQESE